MSRLWPPTGIDFVDVIGIRRLAVFEVSVKGKIHRLVQKSFVLLNHSPRVVIDSCSIEVFSDKSPKSIKQIHLIVTKTEVIKTYAL